MKPTGPTNPILKTTIDNLKEMSFEKNSQFLRDVARYLSKPSRQRVKVNVKHLDRVCQDNETIVVPGIVLGDGNISKKVTVYAWKFTPGAEEKISESGGKCLSIKQLTEKDSKARIIG